LRLWVRQGVDSVLLVPLMSWVAPANRSDALFLEPSLRYCQRHWNWTPDIVLADMAYINLARQRRLREELQVGVITKLRPDFDLPKAIELGVTLRCPQGQKLQWLGLHEKENLHWFAVRDPEPLCPWCWQQSQCPREFSFAPEDHEIVFGMIPVNSALGQRLLLRVRPWIEATQAYDKNRVGLAKMFFNSLRLTAIMALLADTTYLLRAHAILKSPPAQPLLENLLPNQMNFEF
jgi:hypothetical protein